MEDLITVVKQENPTEENTTNGDKVVINITLHKPQIFEKTNSAFGKKLVQDSGQAAENRKNFYQDKSGQNSILAGQCFNPSQYCFDEKVSVKVEQSANIEPELLEDSKPLNLWTLSDVDNYQHLDIKEEAVNEADENQNLEVDNRRKTCKGTQVIHLTRDSNTNKCIKCKKIFSWATDLRRHSKICGQSDDSINSLKRYICDHCNYKTNRKGHLTAHIQAKHLPRDPEANKCKNCKKNFSWRNTLITHSKICGQSDNSINLLKRYVCDHCNYKTVYRGSLIRHIQRKHLPQDSNANKCTKCNKSFSHRSNLLTHLKICSKSEDQIRSLKHYTCDHCNFKTNNKTHLVAHIKAKHLSRDPNANKCTRCKKIFSWATDLRRHSKICGQSEDFINSLKRYVCDHCNFKSNRKGYITAHIQAKHFPRDPEANKCENCKKNFSWRKTLITHSKICGRSEDFINSLKRYFCDHCNFKTNHKGNLANHIKAKHLPRNPNANKCGKCKKSFSCEWDLQRHSKLCVK